VLVMLIISTIILLAVRAQWLSFGFMWPVAGFYLLCGSWTYTIWLQYQHIITKHHSH
jgi:hypothetical protein